MTVQSAVSGEVNAIVAAATEGEDTDASNGNEVTILTTEKGELDDASNGNDVTILTTEEGNTDTRNGNEVAILNKNKKILKKNKNKKVKMKGKRRVSFAEEEQENTESNPKYKSEYTVHMEAMQDRPRVREMERQTYLKKLEEEKELENNSK